MKMLPMLLLLVLGATGCDSIKKAVIKTDKSVEKLAVAVNTKAGSSGAVQNLTADDFDAFIGQQERLVVVGFYSDPSVASKKLSLMLDKLGVEFGDKVAVGKLDTAAHEAVAKKHGVSAVPDVRFYRNGMQVDKMVGLPPEKKLRLRIQRLMAEGSTPPKTGEEKKPEYIVPNAIQKVNGKEPTKDEPVDEKPSDEPKEAKQSAKDKKAEEEKKPKEPAMQPMKKDWMPPGIQRK